MNRVFAWAAEQIATLLEPSEREAVLGDLAESRESGVRAACHLLGLVTRRQAEFWKDWHPWLALIGIVVLAGIMLLKYAGLVTGFAELPLWIISNYRDIDPSILEQNGMTLSLLLPKWSCFLVLLGCWSWTAGFVLARLSGRTTWLNGSLLLLIWVVLSAKSNPASIPAVLLLLPPSYWGIRHALRSEALNLSRVILLSIVIGTLAALVIWIGGMRRGGVWLGGPWAATQMQISLFLSWPVLYMLGVSISRSIKKAAHL